MSRTYNDSMFIKTFETEYTWLNAFMQNVSLYSKKIAIIDPETNRTWTYEELNYQANKLAQSLTNYGIKKDDVVLIALRNCPEFAFCYVGCKKAGAILLAANFNLASAELKSLINHNKPKVIIYSADIKSNIVDATKDILNPPLCILADNIEQTSIPTNHIAYECWTRDFPESNFELNFSQHIYDETVRLCTSGTSSLPKCVPINSINEVLTCHDVIMNCSLNSNDITMNMTPWFHRGGCHAAGITPMFYVGGTVVVMRRFRPNDTLKWVEQFKITFLTGAPANLNILSKFQQKNKFDISNLRGIITMGSPLLKNDCIEYINNLTPNIFNGYGSTETFWNSILHPSDLPEKAGSAGRSYFGDEIRIVKIYDDKKAEPEEEVLKDNETEGEVIIRSPAKSTYSYFEDEKNTTEKFYKGWFYTGDTGIWDSNSFITIKGRKDDMIIVSGENIYPLQIEEVLNTHPKIKDAAITSIADKIRGQAIVAYIILKENVVLTSQELADFLNNNSALSTYKKPKYFIFTNQIPYTATGKKIHSKLKQQATIDFKDGKLQKL